MPQLLLRVELSTAAALDNFVGAANREAIAAVAAIARGEGSRLVYLWGCPGTGKSHLLAACCNAYRAGSGEAALIPLELHHQMSPTLLAGLERLKLVCVDDVERVAGELHWERALFSLFERAEQTGTRLLFGSRMKAQALGLALPDLQSRLGSVLGFQLHDLDDDERTRVLQLRAGERGFQIPPAVGRYLLLRCARDMHNLMGLVDALEHATLVEQRRVTVPFVRRLLRELGSRSS